MPMQRFLLTRFQGILLSPNETPNCRNNVQKHKSNTSDAYMQRARETESGKRESLCDQIAVETPIKFPLQALERTTKAITAPIHLYPYYHPLEIIQSAALKPESTNSCFSGYRYIPLRTDLHLSEFLARETSKEGRSK